MFFNYLIPEIPVEENKIFTVYYVEMHCVTSAEFVYENDSLQYYNFTLGCLDLEDQVIKKYIDVEYAKKYLFCIYLKCYQNIRKYNFSLGSKGMLGLPNDKISYYFKNNQDFLYFYDYIANKNFTKNKKSN